MFSRDAGPIAGIAIILLTVGGLCSSIMADQEDKANRAIACTNKAKDDLEAQVEKLQTNLSQVEAENQQLRQMIKDGANRYPDSREPECL